MRRRSERTGSNAFGDRAFFGGDYLLRAAGAMAGWGGNDKLEGYYPIARVAADGRPLDGAHHYRLTFDTLPPAKAFWSVTIYDTSETRNDRGSRISARSQ